MVLITPNAPNLDNQVTLEPLGDGRFRFAAPTGGGAVGEVVRFVEQAGRPMRIYIGDGWIDRVR
jgi:D-alanyl-D-alanine carboxypeptidase